MVTDHLWQRAQDVFDRVRAAPGERRAVELDAACAGDTALRTEVESLLEHDTNAGPAFLESPGARLRNCVSSAEPWAEGLLDKRIGHYRLVRLIAAGGMGCVFEARQEHPDRAVAVKLLRPGFVVAQAPGNGSARTENSGAGHAVYCARNAAAGKGRIVAPSTTSQGGRTWPVAGAIRL